MSIPRVLSVGQCAFDQRTLTQQFGRQFQAEVVGAESFSEAIGVLRSGTFDLVLVNRVTDADGSSGLDLIGELQADPTLATLPVMLVSDYADAQSAAVALGAQPGFGKSALRDARRLDTIVGAVLTRPR